MVGLAPARLGCAHAFGSVLIDGALNERNETIQQGLHLFVLDNERGQQANDAVGSHVKEQARIERLCGQIGTGQAEFNADHEASTAHLRELRALREDLTDLGHDAIALTPGVVHEPLGLDDLERGKRGPHGQWVSPEGGAVIARLKEVCCDSMCQHRANRNPGAQALGKRHDIRHDIGPLMGKPFSSAANPALNLVEHEQDPTLGAELPKRLKELTLSGLDSSLSLDGLQKDRADLGVLVQGLSHSRNAVERNADEALDERLESSLDLGVRGGRERCEGAAVEGLFEDHNLGTLKAQAVAMLARKLDGGLIGLEPRIAEEGIGHARALRQRLRELFLEGGPVVVGDMDEGGDLLLKGLDQSWVGMAQGVDRNSGERIEILATLVIPDPRAGPSHKRDRETGIGGHEGWICVHV